MVFTMPSITTAPNDVLEALKGDATIRTKRSLDILHKICHEQYERGSLDYSVATIGRLSAVEGGPATQSIRNKEGARYRELLAAWAAFCDGHKKKPPAIQNQSFGSDLLSIINDASVRALVGVVLAENKKLKAENFLLKGQAEVIVDKRSFPAASATQHAGYQVVPAFDFLLPAEIFALKDAISAETLGRNGWEVDEKTGRINKDGRPVFKAGFVTALRKILDKSDCR